MKRDLEILKVREVPEHLDVRILTAARLSASGNIRRNRQKKLILSLSGIAAAFVAGFVLYSNIPVQEKTAYEVQYHALNDLSFIEQETFALASELNCQSVYALDNSSIWENIQ